jgi:hypothetical protein
MSDMDRAIRNVKIAVALMALALLVEIATLVVRAT